MTNKEKWERFEKKSVTYFDSPDTERPGFKFPSKKSTAN